MKKLIFILMLANGVFMVPNLWAADNKWELQGETHADASFYSSNTGYFIGVGAAYQFMRGIQLGGVLNASYSSYSGNKSSSEGLLVGPVFNFPFQDDIANAFYFATYIGFTHYSSSINATYLGDPYTFTSSDTLFTYQIELGKRFAIVDHVSYSPAVNVTQTEHGKAIFTIVPLKFSFFF